MVFYIITLPGFRLSRHNVLFTLVLSLWVVKLAVWIGFVVPIYISILKNDFNWFYIFLKVLGIFDPFNFFFSRYSVFRYFVTRYSLLCLVTPAGLLRIFLCDSSNQRLWEWRRSTALKLLYRYLNDFLGWLSTAKNQPFFINNRCFTERYFSDKVHAAISSDWRDPGTNYAAWWRQFA